MAAPRETAGDRVARVLAEVLWIAEHDGPTLAETAARFGVDEATLLADLDLASMIGSDSEDYADMPVEMYLEGDRVFVHLHAFDRPLRLTPREALGLVVAGSAAVAVGGSTGTSAGEAGSRALGDALDKVAAALGLEVGDQVEVDLGVGDRATFETVRASVDGARTVEITHLGTETDARTTRVVEPWSLFRDRGAWYLHGHCRLARAPRTFRLDRVVEATAGDEPVVQPADLPEPTALRTPADAPRLVLDLAPEARWVVESHPVEQVERRHDGSLRVTLVVVSRSWVERLLLRLGTAARVVALDPPLGPDDPVGPAARRVLARYGSVDGQG